MFELIGLIVLWGTAFGLATQLGTWWPTPVLRLGRLVRLPSAPLLRLVEAAE